MNTVNQVHVYPEPVSGTLLRNRVFADVITVKMSYWIGVDPKSDTTGVLIKERRRKHRDADTERRRPRGDRGRKWSDA